MLLNITLLNNHNTTALDFGCVNLIWLAEVGSRQRLLELSLDPANQHFDTIQLCGLGEEEAQARFRQSI